MIVSGHQPGYLPWLGLFHKLSLCDVFVYMDTVQYLENDWNNRNKIRTSQGWMWLTTPVDRKKSGKMLDEIMLCHDQSDGRDFWQLKHWQNIENNYRKTKYFADYAPELRDIYLDTVWTRLIDLCWAQFQLFSRWLGLDDKRIVRMSEFSFEGKKDRLVLDHCVKLGGDAVVLGTNGRNYVDLSIFQAAGISVYFQDYQHPVYQQRFNGFEPFMGIIDLVFNHGPESLAILTSNNVTKNDLHQGNLWV